MRTAELDYELDTSLIATHPAEPRDSARMLVVYRDSDRIEHRRVDELPEFFQSGDAIVLNTTRVLPARVQLVRAETGASFEGLFLGADSEGEISALVRGAKRLHQGDHVQLCDQSGDVVGSFEVLPRQEERVTLRALGSFDVQEALQSAGRAPLPPYIIGARRERGEDQNDEIDRLDLDWYQTVYARAGQFASVAAPTAGLHFTPELLAAVERAKVQRIDVDLEVGAGTFRPVSTATLEEHAMHSERYSVHRSALEAIAATRERRGRVLAVGTTSCRTLESLPEPLPRESITGETQLLIAPGHHFRYVEGLLTNFHLPRSTLLALVAAFLGLERTLDVYKEAIGDRYRFYSYGDAMLIL